MNLVHALRATLEGSVRCTLPVICLILLLASNYSVAEESASSIVNKSNLANFYVGKDGTGVLVMLIVDSSNRKQKRQFTMYRKTDVFGLPNGGKQEFFVHFTKPSDIRNTTFLVEKYLDKDDNRWLYLPGLDLVKRISAGDKRTSFVGSHIFYEELTGRNPEFDNHELLSSDSDKFIIQSTPKDKSNVRFSSYELWVDKETYLPIKYLYKDDNDNVYRTIETIEFKDVGGFPTITRLKISDLESEGYTLLQYNNIKYNVDLPSSIFSENSLRNPPKYK